MKLTAFCNLNCSYCYMFNLRDRTFTQVPRLMSLKTALETVATVETHLDHHGGQPFEFVLHGGEPTLWPPDDLAALLTQIERLRARHAHVSVSLQTNGFRLSEAMIDIIDRFNLAVGVSIDGPRSLNDAVRVDHRGKGSYDRIRANLDRLIARGLKDQIAGFLCVAAPSLDIETFYGWIKELPVSRVDVLWPQEFTWRNPPWRGMDEAAYCRCPTYGRWFADLFAYWWQKDDPQIDIRLFYHTIQHYLGGRTHIDTIVNDELRSFVVNTDGAIEYHDYFRGHADGAARTSYRIGIDDLDRLAADPVFDYCLNLRDHQPAACRECPHLSVCGGGFLPGRMEQPGSPPRVRSVLCHDQYYFFSSVRKILERSAPDLLISSVTAAAKADPPAAYRSAR